MRIVGFQSGHDVSYCILENGVPIIHEEQERFSRQKMEIGDGLKFFFERNPDVEDVDHFAFGNYGGRTGVWQSKCADEASEKRMSDILSKTGGSYFGNLSHHVCHAANAFYTSDFDDALIITMDGGGGDCELDGTRTPRAFTISEGVNNQINRLVAYPFEVNLGDLWNRMTKEVFGLSVGYPKGDQAGTVMAMATLGNPLYIQLVATGNISELKRISMMSEQESFNVAASLQKFTEDFFLHFAGDFIRNSKSKNLCFSGGVSLNCVMLGKIKEWFPNIDNVFCDPVPYDSGLSIGSARYVWHSILKNPRIKNNPLNRSPYLGAAYSENDVLEACKNLSSIHCEKSSDEEIVKLLNDQKIVSVFGGRSESGRRALGNRSILADPRNDDMKRLINEKVKHRQWFRPFAPSILKEKTSEWFVNACDSPYMSFALKFKEEVKSKVPAVVHYDGTGRLQTVDKELNPWYHRFISLWEKQTGIPIVLNTSFNDSEPIVETPENALSCFLRTNIDFLYFYDYNLLVTKSA